MLVKPQMLFGTAAAAADTGFQISRSIRLDSGSQSYLERKPFAAGNRRRFTFATWMKREPGALTSVLHAYSGTNADPHIWNGNIYNDYISFGGASWWGGTSQYLKDGSNWYHICYGFDTNRDGTDQTGDYRLNVWVNGVKLTAWGQADNRNANITQYTEYSMNAADIHRIGHGIRAAEASNYSDCYFADTFLLDSFYPSETNGILDDFGELDSDTGIYVPKQFIKLGQLNNGQVWSNSVTGTAHASAPKTKLFDGLYNGTHSLCWPQYSAGETLAFKPPIAITASKSIRVYGLVNGSNPVFLLNGTDYTANFISQVGSNVYGWWSCPDSDNLSIDTTNGLQLKWNAGTNHAEAGAIEVDGVVLKDSTYDNSCHLKYSDNSTNNNIGYSEVLNTCTGAQPMYGPGADDDSKSSLIWALPGFDTADHSADIKGSGSAVSHTVTGTVTSTAESKFYNTSLFFDGSNDEIQSPVSTDFQLGTSNFTIEGWFYLPSSFTAPDGWIQCSAGNDDWSMLPFYRSSDGNMYFYGTATSGNWDWSAKNYGAVVGQVWTHYAVVRNGSTFKGYTNGKEAWTFTSSDSVYQAENQMTIGSCFDGGNAFAVGYLNDFRYYKGAAKYTSDFVVPQRNDWKPVNFATAAAALSGSTTGTASPSGSSMIIKAAGGGTVTGTFNASSGTNGNINYYKSDNGNNWTYLETSSGQSSSFTAKWLSFGGGGNNTRQFTSTAGSYQYALNGSASLDNNAATLTVDQTGLTFTGDLNSGAIDSLKDSPTNAAASGDEGAGGEINSNYCTLNSLSNGGLTIKEGNLAFTDQSSAGWDTCKASIFMPASGKWYMEMTIGTWNGSGAPFLIGVADNSLGTVGVELGQNQNSWCFLPTGQKRHNSSTTSHGSAWSSGKVIGVAVDLSGGLGSGKMWVSIDGTWQASGNPGTGANAAFTDIGDTGEVTFAVANAGGNTSGDYYVNFGQRPFRDAAPAGFKCLCASNIGSTDQTIVKGKEHFDVVTYTGNGGSQSVTGLEFQPALVWVKNRSSATNYHAIHDAARGPAKELWANLSNAQTDYSGGSYSLRSFDSNGFTVVDDASGAYGVNGPSGGTYSGTGSFAAWAWAASSVTPSTEGSITPSAQYVNSTTNFSISHYTGTAANATIGHGLSVAPAFILVKFSGASSAWSVYHKEIGNTQRLRLETTGHEETGYWQSTNPSSTVYSVTGDINDSTTIVSYCFAETEGYCKAGKFIGTGGNNYVNIGFYPRWILIKRAVANSSPDTSTDYTSWAIIDTKRYSYNGLASNHLWANKPQGEGYRGNGSNTSSLGDMAVWPMSNGFYMSGPGSSVNASTGEYVYLAIAEVPFSLAKAR